MTATKMDALFGLSGLACFSATHSEAVLRHMETDASRRGMNQCNLDSAKTALPFHGLSTLGSPRLLTGMQLAPPARHAQDESLAASHIGFRTVDTRKPPPVRAPDI